MDEEERKKIVKRLKENYKALDTAFSTLMGESILILLEMETLLLESGVGYIELMRTEMLAVLIEKQIDFSKYNHMNKRNQRILLANDILTRERLSKYCEPQTYLDFMEIALYIIEKKNAIIIQRAFRKFRYNPKYPFCERVLLNNLKEICEEHKSEIF